MYRAMKVRFGLRTMISWGLLALGGALALAPLATRAEAPPPAKETVALEGEALLRDWTPPVYPAAALKAKRGGKVQVRLIVDAGGKVTMARALPESDAEFSEAALAAVRSWGFVPGLSEGKPAACCLDTWVTFSPKHGQLKKKEIPPEAQQFDSATHVSPEAKATPSGPYPEVLTERKIAGSVRVRAVIDASGQVHEPVVLTASHVDFVLPALEALKAWRFEPAKQGDLPVSDGVETEVTYDSIAGDRAEVFEANGIATQDGKPLDVTPEVRAAADPVRPLEALLAGKGGTATVEFVVAMDGTVRDVKVREASEPAYGQALAAAVPWWLFGRPVANHEGVKLALTMKSEFKAIAADAKPEDDPLAALVLALRRGQIAGPKGLDGKLVPIYRVPPLYPGAEQLGGEATPPGRAEIEFIVDRDGRVRLPRVVTATQEAFGWAAATAVQMWVFRPPRRGGVPTAVKVKIPIEFKPPA